MIAWKLKLWRSAAAAAFVALAACGPEENANAPPAGGDQASSEAPAPSPETAVAPAGGEAAVATAYSGLSGDQLTALRLQHLKGFVMAAARVVEEDRPVEAGALVSQGLREAYDVAPDQFGDLNVATIRAAGDGAGLNRAQMMQRIRAANAEIDRAMQGLHADHAVLAAGMIDIATGLYQEVVREGRVDAREYQHSMGAALAARDALTSGQQDLRRRDLRAYSEAQQELSRFVSLWRTPSAPDNPAPSGEVQAQGSRVRQALSPFLGGSGR